MKIIALILVSLCLFSAVTVQAASRKGGRPVTSQSPATPPMLSGGELLDLCSLHGDFAWNIASHRDAGGSMITVLQKIQQRAAFPGGQIHEALLTMVTLAIFQNRWWSPDRARQEAEQGCLTAYAHN